MAVTAANKLNDQSRSSGTSYLTASVAPSANKLLLLAVFCRRTTAWTDADVPTVSGLGLTWTQIATVYQLDTNANGGMRLTLFRAMGSPSSGQLTISLANTHAACAWILDEFGGVRQGGNGADAIRQVVVNDNKAGDVASVTLAAFGDVDNGTYGAFVHKDGGKDPFPGSGFTELAVELLGDSPGDGVGEIATEWKATNDTSVDMDFDAVNRWAAIGVELVEGSEVKSGTAAVSGTGSVSALGTGPVAARVSGQGVVEAVGKGPDYRMRAYLGVPQLTEMTPRLRTWSCARGRSSNLERCEAGTAKAAFKNGDGAPLDPANAASPYPDLRVLAPLELVRRQGGVLYPRFVGRSTDFVPRFVPPSYQEQEVAAVDAFQAFSAYKLESGHASLTTGLSGTHNDLVFTAREAGGRGDEITVAYVVAGNDTALDGETNQPLSGRAIVDTTPLSTHWIQRLFGAGTGSAPAAPPPTVFEVRGSEISITIATNSSGVPLTTASQIKAFVEATPEMAALVTVELAPGNTGSGVVTAMQPTALTGGKWQQEKTGARINRCLDLMGWPASKRRIDSGLCDVVAQGFSVKDNVSVLAHVQDCADSELGYFFVSADGFAVFHDGGHRGREERSLTPQAVLADAAAGAGYLYRDVQPVYNADTIYNRVSVTAGYQGAQPQVAEDLASQLLYSPVDGVAIPRDYAKSTLLANDSDALAVAQAILGAYKDAKVRFPVVTLLERDTPVGWTEAIYGREIGDLVTVRTKPPGHDTVGTYDCFIERIADEGRPGQPVSVSFALSLASEALDIPVPGGPLEETDGDDFVLDTSQLA